MPKDLQKVRKLRLILIRDKVAEDHAGVDDDNEDDGEDDYDDEQYDLYLLQRTMQRWMYCRSRTPIAMLAARITAIKIRSR